MFIKVIFTSNRSILAASIYLINLFVCFTCRATRESYGDDAIGYVQVLRDSGLCTLKCKMCPEHKVRTKAYNVTMIINEEMEEIVSCQCEDCAASAGGCKHAVAFLLWAHRRSEEPASTSVECYWRKPTLSRVGTSLKYITVQQLCKKRTPHHDSNTALLSEFLHVAKKRKIKNCELVKYQNDFKHSDVRQYSLHHFLIVQNEEIKRDIKKMLGLMRVMLDENSLALIEKSTREQSKSSVWYELRYGRITASKAYEVSRCKTVDGSLVAAIMGAKTPDTVAMKRGRILESSVRKAVENKLNKKIKSCGLFVSREYPMIAASPDGMLKDALVEIKCPTSDKTKVTYVKNGVIADKYLAQVQLQMYTTGVKKCYFCVADVDFEKSKNVEIISILFNNDYVTNLINSLATFWTSNIYPLLLRSTNLE